jgi:hypothetical protein
VKLVLTIIEPYTSIMQLMRWIVTMAMAMCSAIIIAAKQNNMFTYVFESDHPVRITRDCILLYCLYKMEVCVCVRACVCVHAYVCVCVCTSLSGIFCKYSQKT